MRRRQVEQFLEKTWKLQKVQPGNWVHVCVKDNGTWRERGFKWPLSPGWSEEFFEDDVDCYFSPNIYKSRGRRRENAIGQYLVWADLDEVNPEHIWRKPTIAWRSSPDRYASLWLLKNGGWSNDLSREVTYTCAADPGGWDITQVLRVPGCRNWKYNPAPRSKLLWADGEAHKSAELRLPKALQRQLESGPIGQSDRSKQLWKLMRSLVESGYGKLEIENLVKSTLWNKHKSVTALRKDIDRALVKTSGKPPEPQVISNDWSLVYLKDITPRKVEWLWYPYIPFGNVTMIEGDPDSMKSWLTLRIASAVSRGEKLPGSNKGVRGLSLIFNAEDNVSETLANRVIKLKADLNYIAVPNILAHTDLERIDEVIEEAKPKLVVLDPLQAYLGGADMNKANETRERMNWLADIAERHRCAVVCVRHLNKSSNRKSVYRGLGSIDMFGAARSVIMIGSHPHKVEENARVMIQTKCNLVERKGPILGYKLTGGGWRWLGPQDVKIEEVMGYDPGAATKALGEVVEWLKSEIESGKLTNRTQALEAAANRNYDDRLVREAWKWVKITAQKKRRKS